MDVVNIQIDKAKHVTEDIADLLCWWEGFKMGLKTSDNDHFIIAQNGIDAIRQLNLKIKDELNKIKNEL